MEGPGGSGAQARPEITRSDSQDLSNFTDPANRWDLDCCGPILQPTLCTLRGTFFTGTSRIFERIACTVSLHRARTKHRRRLQQWCHARPHTRGRTPAACSNARELYRALRGSKADDPLEDEMMWCAATRCHVCSCGCRELDTTHCVHWVRRRAACTRIPCSMVPLPRSVPPKGGGLCHYPARKHAAAEGAGAAGSPRAPHW